MSAYTKNFGLIKLELNDPADITQINQNWETIDEELEKCAADIPVTSEIPEESNIWIDPNEEAVEDTHITNKNNPHGVTATQVGAYPAIEDTYYTGCYYRMVGGVKEWINPPVLQGVEYCTTERWQGKPVYTKLVDFGALPNNSQKVVSAGLSSKASNMLRVAGTRSDGEVLPLWYRDGSADKTVTLYSSRDNIAIITNYDCSKMTAYVQLWYVK